MILKTSVYILNINKYKSIGLQVQAPILGHGIDLRVNEIVNVF